MYKHTRGSSIVMVPWLVGSSWSGIRKPSGKTGVFHTRLSEQKAPGALELPFIFFIPSCFQQTKMWKKATYLLRKKYRNTDTTEKQEKKTGQKKTTWKKNKHIIYSFKRIQRKKRKQQKKTWRTQTITLIFLQKSQGRFQKPKSHRLTWSTWRWSFATFAKAWKLRMAEHALYDGNYTHTHTKKMVESW